MAQRHPTSARRPGKGKRGDEPDDVFVATVYEASTWAEKNRVALIVIAVVVVAAGFGLYSWLDYRERLNEQALVQLEQVQQTVSIGDTEQAKSELDQYLSRFESTPHAGEARLLLADLHLRSGEPQRAIEVLEASSLSLRDPLGVQVRTLLAKAHEAAGEYDAAVEIYLDVADAAELAFQRNEALADAARLRERQGQWAGAAELYEEILDGLEETDEDAGLYRMRLAEARAAAEGVPE